MKIYKLTSLQTDLVYVGKTSQTLSTRFGSHKSHYKNWLKGICPFKYSNFLLDYDDVKMELIEETNNSLREIYWIRKLNSVNFNFNGRDFLICKVKCKNVTKGYVYNFQVKRYKITLIKKRSVDLEYLINYRDDWIKNNQHIFIDE